MSANRGGLVIQYCGRNDTINICTWNVRTLQDNDKQLERRTVIIGRELARYHITIAALSETRLPDESQIEEKVAGYIFFWIGKPANDHRQAGVWFAIRTLHLYHIDTPPKCISERLVTVPIRLSGKNYATIVSAYAPTMAYPDEEKERFKKGNNRQSPTQRQVGCAWRRQCSSRTGPREVRASHRTPWHGKRKCQWLPSPEHVCRTSTNTHQYVIPTSEQVGLQGIVDASSI